jgi:hypothetical protein
LVRIQPGPPPSTRAFFPWFFFVLLVVTGAACAAPSSDRVTVGTTVSSVARGVELAAGRPRPPDQVAALQRLAPDGPTSVPVRALLAAAHTRNAIGGTIAGAAFVDHLKAQLRAARTNALRLMRLPHLESAGYYLGSYDVPGIGVHYIDWHRVSRMFDPAHPAMLLVDAAPGHAVRLAGFSYWVRSTRPPAGFDGVRDVWHQHRGLCFVNGLLERDGVRAASGCAGTWLNGGDLWMLHVWIVPGYENDAGMFAPTNRALCPARVGPESSWC